MKEYKNYCFTDFFRVKDFYDETFLGKCKYLYIGEETCPKTGRLHWQGWISWKREKTEKGARKLMKERHIEFCVGTISQNEKYCRKEGKTVMEYGKLPKQGERTDLNEVKDRIVAGTTVDEICMEDPMIYHQYGRTLNHIEDIVLRMKHRTEMTKGIWYWGTTGVGKSHKVYEDYDPKKCYNWKSDNGWWDGYTGQEIVIINEYRGGQPSFAELLCLVDKWPYEVKRRGKEPAPFLAKELRITSSQKPEQIFMYEECVGDALDQLYRRFEVVEMK